MNWDQEKVWESHSVLETAGLAQDILSTCANAKVFAIFGDLGAGKTTLVQALCKTLGVQDIVKSPSFSLVNEYHGFSGSIYHFDFYRIEGIEEAFDLGYEEYFDSGCWCFVEWPERIKGLLPPDTACLRLQSTGPFSRTITLSCDCLKP